MRRADFILGIGFLALFGIAMNGVVGMRWQAAVAPALAATAGMGLILYHLGTTAWTSLRAKQRGDPTEPSVYDLADLPPAISFLASIMLVLLLGFAAGGAIYVFGSVLIATRSRFWQAAACAAPVYPFFSLFVDRGLGIVMFEGLLPGWLGL